MSAPLLEVRNLSKYFGSVIALKDISTYVNGGEVTCVLGDKGARGRHRHRLPGSGAHPADVRLA
jgi:ABC-type branched-subunit amino acid transport system ATPase component